MHADLETIVCKFGGDPAIVWYNRRSDLRKKFTDGRTDRQTTDAAKLQSISSLE